jgi:hypothetical protein
MAAFDGEIDEGIRYGRQATELGASSPEGGDDVTDLVQMPSQD